MHVRDLPVIGEMIDAALVYVSTLWRIVQRPFAFVHTIDFASDEERRRALKFLGAAIPLGYVIFSPALRQHAFAMGEILFGVIALLRFLLIVVLYHCAFWLVRARRPLWTSLVLGAYINGLYFPFVIATMLPGFLAIGPQFYFGSRSELTPAQTAALEEPLVLAAFLVFCAGFVFFFVLASRWWAVAYGASTWLSATLLAAMLVVAGLANTYVTPLMLRVWL